VAVPRKSWGTNASTLRGPTIQDDASSTVVEQWAFGDDRDEPDEECKEAPGGCILGTILASILGPIFETIFTDLRGTAQPRTAPFGLRLENRFRTASSNSRTYPYFGIGARSVKSTGRFRTVGSGRLHLEVATGYQFSLRPLLGTGSWLGRSAVLGAEAQWLHSDRSDHLRLEVAPGVEIEQSSDHRLLVHLTVGVAAAGPASGRIAPGVSLGYRW
jgi:hypothetical protein